MTNREWIKSEYKDLPKSELIRLYKKQDRVLGNVMMDSFSKEIARVRKSVIFEILDSREDGDRIKEIQR